jgi:hypothetical protein
MSSVAEHQQNTQAALAAALHANRFPDVAQNTATQLLTRLETPTRVSVLGMPGSGKTGIFNLLAGAYVLPEGMPATVHLAHSDVEAAALTLRDGSSLNMDGPLDMAKIAELAPVFIQMEKTLPALRKITLLEVMVTGSRASQLRTIEWAMEQTDIAIWCTETFGEEEQSLWEHATDRVKDHAILMRAKADQVAADRAEIVTELERVAAGEFAFCMSVSARDAELARAGGNLDKAKFKASGATTLISTILRQIERARQYAVDQADVLLRKHGVDATEIAADVAPKRPARKAKRPTPRPMPAVEAAPQPTASLLAR